MKLVEPSDMHADHLNDNSGHVQMRYASEVYAVVVCLSVCVCLSHSGIVSKWLKVGSRK